MTAPAPSAETVAGASFPALGGVAVVQVAEPGVLDRARDEVQAVVDELDLACSRFRHDSELSRLNRSGGRPVRVGPLLLDAVGAALRAAQLTGGAVDPTVGRALIELGYDRDFATLRAASTPGGGWSLSPAPGWSVVEIDQAAGTVKVPPSVILDLGATAKALGADLAAERASTAVGCGVLVALSGDISVAGEPPAGGWTVRVTDDHRSGTEASGQWIRVHDGGLATSSTTVRRWRRGGQVRHHLIDPATGAPVRERWRTVSVAAASCLEANIAATAAIIRPDEAGRWLGEHGLPSRMVDRRGRVFHIGQWPAEGEEPSSEAA